MRPFLLINMILLTTVFLVMPLYSQDVTNGLTAYYPFSGNANDESGNGHNGTPVGATLTSDRFGEADRAYQFDGSAYILTSFVPQVAVHESLSISAWIQTDGGTRYAVVGLERSNHQELGLQVRSDGTALFHFRDDDHHAQSVPSMVDVADGFWHHLVAVRDVATDELRIYVDGALDNAATDVTVTGMNAVQSRALAIGADNNSTFGYVLRFVGAIDDIRIYDRVLSDDDIAALYTEGVEIPIEDQIDSIAASVQGLVREGVLSNGEGRSLVNKLGNALAQLDRDKPGMAVKKLEDFNAEIYKFIRHGTLSREQGQPLIDAANAVVASIAETSMAKHRLAEDRVSRNDATSFALDQNFPNPFNPATTITYSLPEEQHVRLTVYDELGREVRLLVGEVQSAGEHSFTWAARALPSGVYFYRLTAGSFTATRAMRLLK